MQIVSVEVHLKLNRTTILCFYKKRRKFLSISKITLSLIFFPKNGMTSDSAVLIIKEVLTTWKCVSLNGSTSFFLLAILIVFGFILFINDFVNLYTWVLKKHLWGMEYDSNYPFISNITVTPFFCVLGIAKATSNIISSNSTKS